MEKVQRPSNYEKYPSAVVTFLPRSQDPKVSGASITLASQKLGFRHVVITEN
jgi:hypothetical protein